MAELQTTQEVYLLPGGMTGTDWLSYPLRLIGTAHAWLFTSLCRFSDIDEQSKELCPGGMTGTDRLSYPLRHIGTAHALLFTSLCK